MKFILMSMVLHMNGFECNKNYNVLYQLEVDLNSYTFYTSLIHILPITFLETVDSQDCPQENSEGMCQRLIDWFGCWLNYLIMTTACILSHAHGCPWLLMNIFFEYTKAQVLYSYIHICASSGMLEGEETEDATFLSEGTTTLNANKMSYNYEDS